MAVLKLSLAVFVATCALWAVAGLIDWIFNVARESELMIAVNGRELLHLYGWRADLWAFPVTMFLLWVAYAIVLPVLPSALRIG